MQKSTSMLVNIIKLILVSSVLLITLSCKRSQGEIIINGFTQGTTYSIKFWKEGEVDKDYIKTKLENELNRIDNLYSNYRKDSMIEEFNRSDKKEIKVTEETLKLLSTSKEVYKKSHGCYDPTIKPLFSLWGFLKKDFSIPSDKNINKTLDTVGFNKISLSNRKLIRQNPNIFIDFSAIGQGYAIKRLSKILEELNIYNYIVEIGGEMFIKGSKHNKKPWNIGIESPSLDNKNKGHQIISNVNGAPFAIMTSGTYRHFYENNNKKFSHIIDPRTGKPVTHKTVSVTVLHDSPKLADAWSTALLCLGIDDGLKVANKNNIAAIFFTINDEKIEFINSKAILSNNWIIKQ